MEDLKLHYGNIADEWLLFPSMSIRKTFFGMGYSVAFRWLWFSFGVVWKVHDWKKKASKNYYDNLKKIVEREYQEKNRNVNS